MGDNAVLQKNEDCVANFEGRDTKIGWNVGPAIANRRAKGFFKSPKGKFFEKI